MTPERIRAELERGSDIKGWDARDADLASRFIGVDENDLFRGLFPLAVMSQWEAPACDAARMLYRLKPACLLSCRQAIAAMFPKWDVSLEEVVFYLVEQFGADGMRETLALLKQQGQQSSKDLETVEYWIGCFERMQAERHRTGGTAC